MRYCCAACGGLWRNADKADFLPRGRWVATAVPKQPNSRSFHISSLLSPVGMRSWVSIVYEWLAAKDDPMKLKAFVTTVLGETWVQRGVAPRPEKIHARAEGYVAGTLPESARPLIVTVGVDVQDSCLHAEVVAWGRDAESWSLEFLTFESNNDAGTADLHCDAWRALDALISSHPVGLMVHHALVDEGGGHGGRTEIVRAFCEAHYPRVHPVKGDSSAGRSAENRIFTRREIAAHSVKAVHLNVDYMKELLFGYLARGTADGLPPREPFAGFCHFPISYGDDFYRQLVSEEKVVEKGRDGARVVKWRKMHAKNHALDCRVYAMGALFVLFDARRRELVEQGQALQAEKYGWREFWDDAEKFYGRRRTEAPERRTNNNGQARPDSTGAGRRTHGGSRSRESLRVAT